MLKSKLRKLLPLFTSAGLSQYVTSHLQQAIFFEKTREMPFIEEAAA